MSQEDFSIEVERMDNDPRTRIVVSTPRVILRWEAPIEEVFKLRNALEAQLSFMFDVWCPFCKADLKEELFVMGRQLDKVCPECDLPFIKTFTPEEGPRSTYKVKTQ